MLALSAIHLKNGEAEVDVNGFMYKSGQLLIQFLFEKILTDYKI